MDNLSSEQLSGALQNRFENGAQNSPQTPEEEIEIFGCINPNPVYCKTCALAHGAPPFADKPEKAYCIAFPEEKGALKPHSVYFDGEPCEFYQKEEE